MTPRVECLLLMAFLASTELPVISQTAAAGDAEAARCQDRIESVRRDVLGKYADALGELQISLQKVADLEGALTVRAERARVVSEQELTEKNFLPEPKSLKALQVQTASRLQDLVAQVVAETIPKLVELKRQLTVVGKLDEAVSVRTNIEKLQNTHIPAVRVENGSTVTADGLISNYAADRNRADKMYRGQKLLVRGTVGGFRIDPNDGKTYHVFLGATGSGGWVQCSFSSNEYRIREEKTFNSTALVVVSKDGEVARFVKGAAVEIRGTCEGWDESVRLVKCEPSR